MARRRSASQTAKYFSRLIWLIWTLMAGGSVAGWMAPDLPIVGPVVKRVLAAVAPVVEQTDAPTNATGRDGSDPASLTSGNRQAESHGTNAIRGSASTSLVSASKPLETITVASFNIQVFGTSKMSKPWVVDVLAQIVRHFDVVAIQEIRSRDDDILPKFIAAVNADGSRYGYTIGPRLGRSVSTEQYAFLYDANRIEIDRTSIGNVTDPDDLLHREPFVARFSARLASASPFTFWLVNIHTDPDEVSDEVNVLADVFQIMQRARADEDDVLLLGDLNANERQFGRLGDIPGIAWAVTNTTTNTRRTKMYDNILFHHQATSEYTGRWGVVDIESAFRLTREQALEVSDHLPVWAEFSIRESRPMASMASQQILGSRNGGRY
jgi:deoxyribonuclease-1-like protein